LANELQQPAILLPHSRESAIRLLSHCRVTYDHRTLVNEMNSLGEAAFQNT